MKGKSLLLTGTILFSLLFVQCQTVFKNNSKVKLTNELDTASYYLGIFYAQNCYNNYIREVNEKAFQMGFQQVMSQDSGIPAEAIIGQFLGQYSSKLYEASVKEDHKESIEKNEQFLVDNKKKDNVVELSSGLQYSIIKEGTGPRPAISDKVKVHYTGTFIDGQKFDSSVDRGEPASFYVNGVIKGWTEALQLMPVGSKWMLYVPESLAYGARGQGQIPPFSTLVFEVELLEIEKN